MATHDYVISNQSFPSTRTDINNVLAAIVSNNSNATAPATTFANMIWYDTANNKLYIRNEDNDAWIELFVLDQSGDHLEKIGNTITLDGSGNFGVGGVPQHLLDIQRVTNGTQARFMVNDGAINPRLIVYGSATGSHIQHTSSAGNKNLIFEIDGSEGSGTEAARINGTRTLGVGTTNLLDASGYVGSNGAVYGKGFATANDRNDNNGFLTGLGITNGNNGSTNNGVVTGRLVGYIGGRTATSDSNAHVDSGAGLEFYTKGENAVLTMQMSLSGGGNLSVNGSISKGSGSFKIPHPLDSLSETHNLVHSFVEAPQADNIYRGVVDLVDGTASVNIDTVAGMTDGTFVALNREIQCFTSNETGWTAIKGSVSGNILTITAQDNTCTDTISWLVVGERKDAHMYDTDWTDDNGKVIVEPLRPDDVDTSPPFDIVDGDD